MAQNPITFFLDEGTYDFLATDVALFFMKLPRISKRHSSRLSIFWAHFWEWPVVITKKFFFLVDNKEILSALCTFLLLGHIFF